MSFGARSVPKRNGTCPQVVTTQKYFDTNSQKVLYSKQSTTVNSKDLWRLSPRTYREPDKGFVDTLGNFVGGFDGESSLSTGTTPDTAFVYYDGSKWIIEAPDVSWEAPINTGSDPKSAICKTSAERDDALSEVFRVTNPLFRVLQDRGSNGDHEIIPGFPHARD